MMKMFKSVKYYIFTWKKKKGKTISLLQKVE